MLKDKIKELRKKCGKTQAQLGDCLGVTQQAIERWENGRTEPNASMLIQISKFFGVTVDYLLDVPDESLNIDRSNAMDMMIKMYQKLNPEERQVINRYIDSIIDAMGYVKKSDLEKEQQQVEAEKNNNSNQLN